MGMILWKSCIFHEGRGPWQLWQRNRSCTWSQDTEQKSVIIPFLSRIRDQASNPPFWGFMGGFEQ